MTAGCKIDTAPLQARMNAMQKQLRFAVSKALNDGAFKASKGVQAGMSTAFNNPTPYTLNSLFVQRSTKAKLTAVLQFKDQASRGTPASRYLAPEVLGGARGQKPFEKLENKLGILPAGKFIVPARGVRLNRYGNVSLQQLETVLQAATGAKFTKSKRNAKGKSKPLEVFVGSPGGGRLPMGIWQRMKGGTIKPLFLFVNRSNYKARLPMGQIAADVYAADLPALFEKALADAMATAKP